MCDYSRKKITKIESYSDRGKHDRNRCNHTDVTAIDRKFQKLNHDDQVSILHQAMGYCSASADLIIRRGFARDDEISDILQAISDSISERVKC